MSSSRSNESRVISANIDHVWSKVRSVTFDFWPAVQKVDVEGSVDAVGSIRTIYFKDGSVQKYQIRELSDLEHFVTYEVIESSVPTLVLAAYHTIRLRKVTHDNTTFVDFSSEFASGENTATVVEDSKYKKIEALEFLRKNEIKGFVIRLNSDKKKETEPHSNMLNEDEKNALAATRAMMKNRFAFAPRQQPEGKEQNDRVPEIQEQNHDLAPTPSLGAQQVPLLYAEVDTDVDLDVHGTGSGGVGGDTLVFARVDVGAGIQRHDDIHASDDTQADMAPPSLDSRFVKPRADFRIASPVAPSIHSRRSTSHAPSLSCVPERNSGADTTHDLAAYLDRYHRKDIKKAIFNSQRAKEGMRTKFSSYSCLITIDPMILLDFDASISIVHFTPEMQSNLVSACVTVMNKALGSQAVPSSHKSRTSRLTPTSVLALEPEDIVLTTRVAYLPAIPDLAVLNMKSEFYEDQTKRKRSRMRVVEGVVTEISPPVYSVYNVFLPPTLVTQKILVKCEEPVGRGLFSNVLTATLTNELVNIVQIGDSIQLIGQHRRESLDIDGSFQNAVKRLSYSASMHVFQARKLLWGGIAKGIQAKSDIPDSIRALLAGPEITSATCKDQMDSVRRSIHVLIASDDVTPMQKRLLRHAGGFKKLSEWNAMNGPPFFTPAKEAILKESPVTLAKDGVFLIDLDGVTKHDMKRLLEVVENPIIETSFEEFPDPLRFNSNMILWATCTLDMKSSGSKSNADPNVLKPIAMPLLPKFDVCINLKSSSKETHEQSLAEHLLLDSMGINSTFMKPAISNSDLAQFLQVVSSIRVDISSDCSSFLQAYFTLIRKSKDAIRSNNATDSKVVTMESLVRIAMAHARICLRRNLLMDDVLVTIMLVEESTAFVTGCASALGFVSLPEDQEAIWGLCASRCDGTTKKEEMLLNPMISYRFYDHILNVFEASLIDV
ncbi:hypothetical protein CcCBS67573_g04313 [Chytriomyces confervae]|uniref:MCM AAA-lid domain-containing protein n=1 Tax=Chytriomyces confervae TaxID=246404 RepID=A0A507FDV0_9FUNG|nr:hypothetical protein CcCBS67573_g04313 [Chytriomyces confervae]